MRNMSIAAAGKLLGLKTEPTVTAQVSTFAGFN
jgi:hypothetical protein